MNQHVKALSDVVVPEAIEWVKELRAYRIYQGKDPEYFRKARIGIGVVSGAIRLCATAENSRTNDMLEQRAAELRRELREYEAGAVWTCVVCGRSCGKRRQTCRRLECTGEFGRRCAAVNTGHPPGGIGSPGKRT